MSADNWAVCPRCYNREDDRVTALVNEAANSYGKVPVEEYERLTREARAATDALEAWEPNTEHATFREDYEIYGVSAGTLQIDYSGMCTVCGLTHKFYDFQTLDLSQ